MAELTQHVASRLPPPPHASLPHASLSGLHARRHPAVRWTASAALPISNSRFRRKIEKCNRAARSGESRILRMCQLLLTVESWSCSPLAERFRALFTLRNIVCDA